MSSNAQDVEQYTSMFNRFGLKPVVVLDNGQYTVTTEDGDGGSTEAYFSADGKFIELIILSV